MLRTNTQIPTPMRKSGPKRRPWKMRKTGARPRRKIRPMAISQTAPVGMCLLGEMLASGYAETGGTGATGGTSYGAPQCEAGGTTYDAGGGTCVAAALCGGTKLCAAGSYGGTLLPL